jgi:hypothetical protein
MHRVKKTEIKVPIFIDYLTSVDSPSPYPSVDFASLNLSQGEGMSFGPQQRLVRIHLAADCRQRTVDILKPFVFISNGQPSIFSKGTRGYLYAGRCLSSFVFASIYHLYHLGNGIFIKP